MCPAYITYLGDCAAGAGTCLRGDELSKECRLFLSETFVRFVFFVVK